MQFQRLLHLLHQLILLLMVQFQIIPNNKFSIKLKIVSGTPFEYKKKSIKNFFFKYKPVQIQDLLAQIENLQHRTYYQYPYLQLFFFFKAIKLILIKKREIFTTNTLKQIYKLIRSIIRSIIIIKLLCILANSITWCTM